MSAASTVGGFFALELPSSTGHLPPTDAALFGSGRACLRAILELTRSQRLLAPFYVCDAALEPARALGLPISFYQLDCSLRPVLSDIRREDLVLVVDYFGIVGIPGDDLASLGERLVLDHTQALFADGLTSSWRFTSARKWFGVPDGAFLHGPRRLIAPAPAPLPAVPVHLVEKRWGDASRAYDAFQKAEAAMDAQITPISDTSVALLGGVDVARVRDARRRNFQHLHERLSSHNMIDLPLRDRQVPFCYPLLSSRAIGRPSLAAAGIFVPQFWADCLKRDVSNFFWERELSRRLLPLPVDHRYGVDDMDRVADAVLSSIERGEKET